MAAFGLRSPDIPSDRSSPGALASTHRLGFLRSLIFLLQSTAVPHTTLGVVHLAPVPTPNPSGRHLLAVSVSPKGLLHL